LIHFFFFLFFKKKIGALIAAQQAILSDWYTSLASKGTLSWSGSNYCTQTGVTCTPSSGSNQQVSKL